MQGSLSARWRARSSGDAHDQDAYGLLAIEVGDAAHDRVTGHFLGRLSSDLDGQGNANDQAVFGSLQDTHDSSTYFDLYEASVDVDRPFDAEAHMRFGRQFDYTTPVIAHYDGLRVESKPIGGSEIVAGAFGGVPVRLYNADTTANQVGGAWTEARPWTGGRVRADWMHVHQDGEPTGFYDDIFGLALWQHASANLDFNAAYTRLESEDRDVRLRGTWNDGKGDFLVQADYYQLLNPQAAFAEEFDPYYSTLQQYEPYRQYRLMISKALGHDLRLDIGGDLRDLEAEQDENRTNHDYQRGYATAIVSEFLMHGLDLSLTGDVWNSDDQDINTWGIDLTATPGPKWRVSAGSAYALYKYYPTQDVERDDVRTWYARVRRTLSTAWTVALEYDYEDDNYDDFQQITAGATWHF